MTFVRKGLWEAWHFNVHWLVRRLVYLLVMAGLAALYHFWRHG